MAKKALPRIYFDEHIKEPVIEAFKDEGFKCLLISNTRKYAGRDEKDYINEIYADGSLFVTCDIDFVEYIEDNKIKHAGIVLIPPDYNNEEYSFYSTVLARIIKGYLDEWGKYAWKNAVIYISQAGYSLRDEKGGETLLYSWEAIAIDYEMPDEFWLY